MRSAGIGRQGASLEVDQHLRVWQLATSTDGIGATLLGN